MRSRRRRFGIHRPAIVADLARRGFSVRAASRRPRAPTDGSVTNVALPDLGGNFDAAALADGADAIVHVAGLAHADAAYSDARYQSINADAPQRLAIAARNAGVQRFLLISSVRAQCGPSSSSVLTEASPPTPTDAYGRSKLAAEAAIAKALSGGGVAFAALRPVLVYGPGVKGNMAALMRLAKLPVPLPFGGFTGRRSILSIANLSSAVAHALAVSAPLDGAFLVADDAPVTTPQIIAALRAGAGRRLGQIAVPETAMRRGLVMLGRAGLGRPAVWRPCRRYRKIEGDRVAPRRMRRPPRSPPPCARI